MESARGPRRVAVVGLGAGALAAYARPRSAINAMDFYEIDPEVVRIARDPKLFTYVTDAERARAAAGQPLEMRFVIGDGRLELARAAGEEGKQYDLIVLDAFSSDAIPVHLLTREAIAVYRSRLAPGGLIAIHISNRHIDLVPVLDALARADSMVAVFATDPMPPDELRQEGKVSSQWAVLARDAADLKVLTETPGMSWGVPDRPLGARAWTDDWSDVVSQLRMFR
jgi:spermidine synthase